MSASIPIISIVICTFRREAIHDCLNSLAEQTNVDPATFEVLVVDNDETDALKSTLEGTIETCPMTVRYVHAPSRNISIARNAALDNARADWLLFIDDDQLAERDWVAEMLAARHGAQAVIGQVQAVYGDDLPDWVERCDFHSNRIDSSVENAYGGNSLMNLPFIRKHELRFRLDLGLTGGEDTIFFKELSRCGGVIRYCPEAVVFEPVPSGRASMKWIRRRFFRAGQTHGLLTRDFNPRGFRSLWLSAGAKALFSTVMSVITIPGTVRSRRWWARACLHAGALSYRIRPTILEEYA